MERAMLPFASVMLVLGTAAAAAHAAAAEGREPAVPPARVLENGSFTPVVNGRRIHFEVHGHGPALVALTNSWGLSLEALRVMYRPLERKLTLVYFDPRGMGGSGPATQPGDLGLTAVREDFQALREHLRLPKVHVIGWSNGAINLLFVAADRPETLESAIFVHGMASFGPDDAADFKSRQPRILEMYESLMAETSKPGLTPEQQNAIQRRVWLNEYFPALCADPGNGRALVATVFKDAQLSWAHAQQTNAEGGRFDLRPKLPSIRVRSLVIAGRHDIVVPERVKAIADGLPDSRFVVFEKSGHFSPVEEPEGFRQAVFDFLGVGQ